MCPSESSSNTTDDIVDRLRGIYSMGPFGKRNFHGQFIPPINVEAADEIERLRASLAWVDQVYPSTTTDGGARVEMTWDEFNAMRDAVGLPPRKPTRRRA